MTFDAIVGNPPYQSTTGGGSEKQVAATQAKPIFNLFVEQAKALNPHYLSMIIPARWYSGGIGLNNFRANMLSDRHITQLYDFINSRDCFSTVDIAGGLCYFLWDKNSTSDCLVTNISGMDRNSLMRPLNEFDEIFIRSNEAMSIIHKVRSKADAFMDASVSAIDMFGFPSKARGKSSPFKDSISLIHSQGTGYVSRDEVKKLIDESYDDME